MHSRRSFNISAVVLGAIVLVLSGCSAQQVVQVAPTPVAASCHPASRSATEIRVPVDMVFEGGGAKGTVFVGALEALESQGIEPNRLVGTSAGAITATLLAAGYTAKEMSAAVNEKVPGKDAPVFSTFMDDPVRKSFSDEEIRSSFHYQLLTEVMGPIQIEQFKKGLINVMMSNGTYRLAFSFVERGGLYSGDAFVAWFTKKLNEKCDGFGAMTLAQFHQATGKELTVIAADTAGERELILNFRTAPNVPVVWAVRMSMSIPFVWQEVHWQPTWGKYRAPGSLFDTDMSGHTIVDGGLLSNFAIGLLMSPPGPAPVLGFLIDEELPVPGASPDQQKHKKDRPLALENLKVLNRVMSMVDTMRTGHDNGDIEKYASQIIRLPAKGYGVTEFAMTPERTSLLIAAGNSTTKRFLDEWVVLKNARQTLAASTGTADKSATAKSEATDLSIRK